MSDRIEEKLDRLTENVSEIKVDLAEHMRRTAVAEQGLALLRTEVEPLKRHVWLWAGAGKVLAVLGTLAGLAASLVKVFGK